MTIGVVFEHSVNGCKRDFDVTSFSVAGRRSLTSDPISEPPGRTVRYDKSSSA